MSIKEALNRNTVPKSDIKAVVRTFSYKDRINEQCNAELSMLSQSGAIEMLKELAEIIRLEFTDVSLMRGGAMDKGTSMVLEWGHDKGEVFEFTNGARRIIRRCKSIIINPDVTAGELEIRGKEIAVVGGKDWKVQKNKLEDAIVQAYKDPQSGSSIQDFFHENFVNIE